MMMDVDSDHSFADSVVDLCTPSPTRRDFAAFNDCNQAQMDLWDHLAAAMKQLPGTVDPLREQFLQGFKWEFVSMIVPLHSPTLSQ